MTTYLGSAVAGADELVAVTPSDVTVLEITRGLYIGGAGTLSVRTNFGATVNMIGLAAGVVYPFRVVGVNSTGTTATGIVALR